MKAKELRNKLIAAALMLTVSATMLGGTSYAWFTLSTNPEVTNISASVTSNENLEIALDTGYVDAAAVDTASNYKESETSTAKGGSQTGNSYTWGNLLDLDTAFKTINNTTSGTKLAIAPVKYDAGTLKYPQYGLDGRISTLAALTPAYISNGTGYGSTGGVAVYKKAEGSKVYDAFSVTFWMRSNEGTSVSLCEEAKRALSMNDTSAAATDVNGVTGAGSTITFTLATGGENTEDLVAKYAKHLVVRFDEVTGTRTTLGYAKLTKTSGTTYKLELVDASGTAETIDLTANTAKKIEMLVYLDGETITNADALLDEASMTLNIQFSSSEIVNTDSNGYGAMDGATVTTTNP